MHNQKGESEVNTRGAQNSLNVERTPAVEPLTASAPSPQWRAPQPAWAPGFQPRGEHRSHLRSKGIFHLNFFQESRKFKKIQFSLQDK
jgi:hypothetical protein